MRIAFFCEWGRIKEIGTGHLYRSKEVARKLEQRGHDTEFVSGRAELNGYDVLVVDHMNSQKKIIEKATRSGSKVILIDGSEEDVALVDVSISAFVNKKAQYRGIKYVVFPKSSYDAWNKYRAYTPSRTVFVSMGGFDAGDLAETVLSVLDEMELNAIITKSINHDDWAKDFSRVEVFEESNYYDAMRECLIGITNGGLTMFQALFYGLPVAPLYQYEHQKINIDGVRDCCYPIEPNKADIADKVSDLMESEYLRSDLSLRALNYIDGRGVDRVCALIEGAI